MKEMKEMKEMNHRLFKKLFHMEMLMHRYHNCSFRSFGPFGNPLRGQGRILSVLKLKPQITQKELSYLLDMRQQSLSELLAKLEGKGLITRQPSEEDRRVVMIQLTEEGKKAASESEEEVDLGNVFDCFNETEQKAFENYLDRLIEVLGQKLDETDCVGRGAGRHGLETRGFGTGGFGHGGQGGGHGHDGRGGHRGHKRWQRQEFE